MITTATVDIADTITTGGQAYELDSITNGGGIRVYRSTSDRETGIVEAALDPDPSELAGVLLWWEPTGADPLADEVIDCSAGPATRVRVRSIR